MRTALPLAVMLLASCSAIAADYPGPIVRHVPRGERWATPAPPPAPPRYAAPLPLEEPEEAPAPRAPLPPRYAPPRVAAPPAPVLAPPPEDWTVYERWTYAPAPAPVYAPPPAPPPCSLAVVAGLVDSPWQEGLAVRTGPNVIFPLLAHLFNGQPLWVCDRQAAWLEVVEPVSGLRGWSHYRWIVPAGVL